MQQKAELYIQLLLLLTAWRRGKLLLLLPQ
jgi:hypothetical protein